MSDVIKVYNYIINYYNRKTGLPNVVEEIIFKCSACDNIVNEDDNYCWFCASKLKITTKEEYYSYEEQLDKSEYETLKTVEPTNIKSFIDLVKYNKLKKKMEEFNDKHYRGV